MPGCTPRKRCSIPRHRRVLRPQLRAIPPRPLDVTIRDSQDPVDLVLAHLTDDFAWPAEDQHALEKLFPSGISVFEPTIECLSMTA